MLRRPRSFSIVLVAVAALFVIVWQSARMQSPLRRITNTTEEGTSINPSMSGDGRIVGFESTEDVAGAGGFESFRAIRANVSVDPPTFLQLGATRAPAPAISQDGSRIAFASKDNPVGTNADANSEIFLYDGAKLIQLTNTSPGDVSNRVINGNFLPSISDDGRYVAFSSNRNLAGQNADGNLEIFIFDTVALTATQLTNSSGTVGFSDAKISGNGAFVAYIRDTQTSPTPTPSTRRDLLLQSRTNASPLRALATDVLSIAMTHGRAISDDGTRVVWAAETAANTTQVFLFDGRNNTTRQITTLGSRATDVPLHATISGDGSRIAFATRRSFLGNSDGSVDLYAYDIPSASFGRVTSGPSTATAEVVSSLNDDGSVIAFNFPRVLSGVSNTDFANNSEIYITGTPSRPAAGTLTVVNGASFGNEPATTEAVAPDSIAVARGSVLANTTERAHLLANGTLPLTVGGTTVTVNGRPAQIIFVSPTQVNFIVPPETELGTAEVIVTNSDNFPSRGNVTTLRAAPGIFTYTGDGLGDAAVLDASTLLPAPFDPTSGNLRLIIFSTGVRNGTDVSVTAGGRALTIESIVASPTMPGLDEIHVLVPADLRGAGKVDLVVRAGGRDSNPAAISFTGDSKRDIVINEFLADPPDGLAGDANKDGVRSTGDDEFVELVNTTTHDIDISGYQILTRGTGADTIRHTFASGTILPACTAVVVFGGGNLAPSNPAFGGAQILEASSGSLTLINSAGVITLRDQAATIVNFVSYGGSTGVDGDSNQSVTRSPDTTGAFILHQSAAGPGGSLFSPGTRINGTPFNTCTPISRIEVSPSSATIEAGGQQQFSARAFDDGGNEVTGVIFSWQSSNPAAATIDQNGRATAWAPGSTQIRATGRGVQSPAAILTVTPATPILTSITISPASATTRVGETQQFTAQAKDQFGQNMGGVTISFASSNSAVATVDDVSGTSATGSATATVTGRASGVAEITATAGNGSVTVASSPAILTVEPGAGQLLISEFRTRGPNGASDEFIEIYNPTLSTITIGGLKIRASNSAGTMSDRVTIAAGTTLLSGRHYLVTNSTANTGYSGAVSGNQTYATGIADDGGIAITGSNGTSIIDAVGMSSGSAFKEGTTLAPLTNNVNQSYERKPGGASGNGTDTNNNASDFFLNATSSNPQNLDSAGLDLNTADLIVTKTDSPDPVTTGSSLTYAITVSNNGPGTAQSVLVTDNLPASVTFVSCSATAGGTCGGTGNNRTISYSSLASGTSSTITLVVTVNAEGGTNLTNTASATSATADPVSGNNSADASTVVQAPPIILSINDVTANEGNSGTTTFTFTVSSSAPAPAGGITFDIGTQDNTATTANNDYVARSLTAQTIPAGQQTYAFDVAVNSDLLVESNETFFVNLTNVSGANAPDAQGQGTIQNDDAANLVISQVYAGGGNSGAQFTNDFVEIFNRGATTIDFAATPYSIQYAGATANFGSKVDLTSGTIGPGKYFLVQLSSGGATGVALPTPDASGSINMAATAGKVSLVVGTLALPASTCPGDDGVAPFNPNNATIADFVGYGSSAVCYEGPTGPAPAPSATNADFRKTGGCTDTDDNAADFLVAAAAPRNSSSPVNVCGAPLPPSMTINDVTVIEGNSGTVTATFTVTLSAPAPAGGVSFDIATTDGTGNDGSPAGEDNDYVGQTLTGQTILAGNLAYTFEVTVNGDGNVEPDETFFVNVTNVSGATVADGQGQGTIQNDDTATVVTNLVISQVYGGGGNSGAVYTNDYVEIFNRGTTAVDFATTPYSIQYAGGTANFGSNKVDLTSGTIGPGKYFLVQLSSGGATGSPLPTPDASGSISMAATAGKVALVVGTTALNAASCPVGAQVSDFVGYGTTAECFEGADAAPAPSATTADFRKADGCTDTNDNAADFLTAAPAPRNTSSPTNDCTSPPAPTLTINNVAANEGNTGTTIFTFVVTLSAPALAGGVSFNIATQDNTATVADTDYVARTLTSQTIAAGNLAYSFDVTVNGDLNVEPNETFFVNVTNVSGATVGDGQGLGTIQNDDTADDLVISQIYAGGGNSGAQFSNDFVELFNRGAATVDFAITPYSIQYAGATANFGSNKVDLTSGTIGPGKYFLVQLSSGGATGAPLPTPDATGSINMAATAGKVALVIGTVSLPVSTCPGEIEESPFNPNNATIVDFVGYGTSAVCYEGETGPAPAPSATTADFRLAAGCTDTDDNAADFMVAAPAPRNTSSPTNNCNGPRLTVLNGAADEGDSGTSLFNFIVTLSEPAPGGGVTFDIATQDNSASVADGDYVARTLTSQTIPSGATTFQFEVTVNGDLKFEINETFFINVTNISVPGITAVQGVGTIRNDDPSNLVISQVYGGGSNSGAPFTNDFVEIFNRGNLPINFVNTPFSIQYAGATANFGANKVDLTSGIVGPGQYFLVQLAGGAVGAPLPTPDASGNIVMAATAGKVALVIGTSSLPVSSCPRADESTSVNPNHPNIADFVGYGSTAICYEGSGPAPAPSGTTADFRKAGGCIDTNDNSADLFVLAPSPRNSASPVNNCTGGTPPTLSINDVTVTEGNAGTRTATFTVSLSSPASGTDVTFNIATQNNTATTGNSDYVSRSLTNQIIPAGQQTYTFDVTVNGDTAVEPDETFFVNVTNVTGATVADGQGTGTIQHDDVPSLSINDVSLTEGNAGTKLFTFNVSLSAPAPGTVTFDLATQDNTATVANNDYVARSLTSQTIPTGSQNYSFDVTVNGDVTIEPNETFFVNVTNVSGAIVSDPQGLGTIQNDDSPMLSIDDVSANEGNGGTTIFTFTVTSSLPAPAGGITFDIATADGTAQDDNPASEDNDYVANSATGQTITAGNTTKTFQVTVNGDLLVEPNETFFVNISNVSGGTISDGQGQGTIQNDDTASLVISQLYAGGGNSGAQFTHDFVEIFNPGSTTINFAVTPYSVQYAGATANFGSNKTDLTSGAIAPGKYFLVQLGSGGAVGAPLPPADATGSTNMAATAGKVALVAGTIALPVSTCPGDDGTAPFNPNNLTIADFVGYGSSAVCYEGATGPAPAPSATVADFRKAGGCTDTNDNAADFFVHAPIPRNSSSPGNNCVAGAPPNLTIDDVTVIEGNAGTTVATFTVSLSAPAPSTDITFDIATQNNTATAANSDYVTKTQTNQIIPAGQQTFTFTVTVNGDTAVENDETFFVNVTNVSGATLLDGQGVGTIQNDDMPSLSINDVSLNEGNAGPTTFTFTVSLSANAPTGGVTFNIATQDNTATVSDNDYVTRTVLAHTIPAGSSTYAFDVTVNGDLSIETNETFLVNVTSVSGATVTDGVGQGTILNDDSPTLSINDVTQTETDSGTTIFTFTVTSSLPAPAGGITFDIATADGTAQDDTPATEDNDYIAKSLTGQTISAGNTIYTFDVTVNGDTLVESNETFLVNVTATAGASGSDQGTGTIQNDDAASLVITQIYGGGNNSGATFQNDFVELFNRGTTTVNFGATAYSVQYASSAGTFSSGNTINLTSGSLVPGQYFLIKLAPATPTIGAALPTPDATDTGINLSATDGKVALVAGTGVLSGTGCPIGATVADFIGYGSANCAETAATAVLSATKSARRTSSCVDTNNNSADFTVVTNPPAPRNSASPLNDCNAPPNLTIDNVSVAEGNGGPTIATFTVSLSSPAPLAGVTFDIGTQNDSATTADNDYAANTLTAQTITAGNTTYTFDVTVNGDVTVEPDQTFFVNVTNVTGAVVVDGQGVGTIQNDDNPAFSIDDVVVTEGDSGTTSAGFTVTLAPVSNQIVTVNYATADNTAVAPGDYQSTSGMLTFNPGEISKPVNVLVNGETTNESICETFFVNLSVPTGGATISDSQGQGSITDNDGTKVVVSQVYGGGGNSGAPYRSDFIELFNRGNTAVSLNGWSVQYASSAGTSWSVTSLPNISLQPGQYFLVQEAGTNLAFPALPTADATGTIDLSATAGKVALVNNTVALSGSCPSGGSILDLIGYGGAATCREGAVAADNAPAPSNTTADLRKLNGCQDKNNNQQDFATGAPSPRNTSVAVNICSCSTSYSSMFTIPGFDSWKNSLALLIEDNHAPPRGSDKQNDLINTLALAP